MKKQTRIEVESQSQGEHKDMEKLIPFDFSPESLVAVRGATSKTPSAVIAGNGQVRFNRAATDLLLSNFKDNPDKMTIAIGGGRHPNGGARLEFFPASDKDRFKFKANWNEKARSLYFSASALFRNLKYDYTASGNQSFELKTNGQKDKLILEKLPEGSLTPKPVVARPRKPKVETADVKQIEVPAEPELVNA